MAEITVTFDIGEGVNPTLVDPEDIAGQILDVWNEDCRANGYHDHEAGMTNLEAEWVS